MALFVVRNGFPKRYCLVLLSRGKGERLTAEENIPAVVKFCQDNDYDPKKVLFELPKNWPFPTLKLLDKGETRRFRKKVGTWKPVKRLPKKGAKNKAEAIA